MAPEESTMEEEQTPEESEEVVASLPNLALSADAIFERLGAEAVPDSDDIDLEGFFLEDDVEAEDEQTTELLPELTLDTEPEDVGVLPDPFGDDEEEETKPEERAWFIVHCYSG